MENPPFVDVVHSGRGISVAMLDYQSVNITKPLVFWGCFWGEVCFDPKDSVELLNMLNPLASLWYFGPRLTENHHFNRISFPGSTSYIFVYKATKLFLTAAADSSQDS